MSRFCACAWNAGIVFPTIAGEWSWHAKQHMHHSNAVMYAGIPNEQFSFEVGGGENIPGIPCNYATCNFMYLVWGPWDTLSMLPSS